MKLRLLSFLCPFILGVSTLQTQHKTVTIAAVNNPDMIEIKKLSSKFEQENPDITLQWVIVEENILRQCVTTDVSTGSGGRSSCLSNRRGGGDWRDLRGHPLGSRR